MIQFKENAWTDGRTEKWKDRRTERWMEGQKDGKMDGRTLGQTLFYRTLPATARGQIRIIENLQNRIKKQSATNTNSS